MDLLQTTIESGFFNEGALNPDRPSGKCSIQAAVSRGMVLRDVQPENLWLPMQNIRMPYVGAIALGLVDQTAVDYIEALPGTNKPAPFTRVDFGHEDDTKRATVAESSGTPEGALLAAVKQLISAPDSPDGEVMFLEAVRTTLAAPKVKKA